MPVYDFMCPNCGYEEYDVINQKESRVCSKCKKIMVRLFPVNVHTKIGTSVDSEDPGVVTMRKNEQLKRRESGYSHESDSLRDKIQKQIRKKQAK